MKETKQNKILRHLQLIFARANFPHLLFGHNQVLLLNFHTLRRHLHSPGSHARKRHIPTRLMALLSFIS
jgi:hypothetical protein